MKVYENSPIRPTMGQTKTYEDFAKFLGAAPHRLGIMSRMYPDLTASYLTESLLNIYTNDAKTGNKFQGINSLVIEWDLDVNQIKRVEFAAAPQGDGANGSDVIVAFKERYYEKYDTFRVEGSRQMFLVKSAPFRKSDQYWESVVQLVGEDSIVDSSAIYNGAKTRFMSNFHPELSEEGYTKYQSNTEKHKNYISLHRNDISFSAQFAALEDVFIDLGTGKGNGKNSEVLYKMKTKEKELLDSFLEARNNALVWSKDNHDINGKCLHTDPHTGRPIHMGDGIVPQIERYANKYSYAKMSIPAFDRILSTMRQKTKKSRDNKFMFIVNEILWTQIQTTLRTYLADFKTDGAWFYSKKTGGDVSVGATFDTYVFGGNQLTFTVDKAFSLEYPDSGYGICLDLTADSAGGPAMAMFTLKGGEFIRSVLKGVGGLSGTESGEVSSPVAGSKIIHMGYAGVSVFNPYRSMIISEGK